MKKKFNSTWSNQSNIGFTYGLSAKQIGEFLTKHRLKNGKYATDKAIEKHYAKLTPLKDGTPYYMWNVKKVKELLNKEFEPISELQRWRNKIEKDIKKINQMDSEGNDKMAGLLFDSITDNIPKEFKQQLIKEYSL